jgi:hypothetical protein
VRVRIAQIQEGELFFELPYNIFAVDRIDLTQLLDAFVYPMAQERVEGFCFFAHFFASGSDLDQAADGFTRFL